MVLLILFVFVSTLVVSIKDSTAYRPEQRIAALTEPPRGREAFEAAG